MMNITIAQPTPQVIPVPNIPRSFRIQCVT
jgi:hypothetical protein